MPLRTMFKVTAILILLVLCLAFSYSAKAESSHGKTFWTVHQVGLFDTQTLFDDQSLQVNFSTGLVLQSHAPDWNIFLFNRGNKSSYRITESELRSRGISTFQPMPKMNSPFNSAHQAYLGQPAIRQAWRTNEDEVQMGQIWFSHSDEDRPEVVYGEYQYTFSESVYPDKVCNILQAIYRVPLCNKLPLQFIGIARKGPVLRHIRMRTESISKEKNKSFEVFDTKNFRACKDLNTLLYGSGQSGNSFPGLNEMLEYKDKLNEK